MRDYQRSKVYAAENKALDMFPAVAKARDMEWCEDFKKEIMDSEHWKKHKGWAYVNLHHGAGHRSAGYYSARRGKQRTVTLPKFARSKAMMIHEFAHALTDRTHKNASGHGTYFCGHYIALVQELLGRDRGEHLASHFKDHGVRFIEM